MKSLSRSWQPFQKQSIKVAPEALAAVARLANGGMRDSQSILDQMISFCGKEITEQDVLDVYGLVSAERITQLAGALGTLDFAAIIAAVDGFVSEGRDLYRILVDLEAEVRRALLDAIKNEGQTQQLGAALTTESLMRMLDALHEGVPGTGGLSEKVNFEVVLLKAAEESRSRAIDTVLKQLAGKATAVESGDNEKKLNLRDLKTPLIVPLQKQVLKLKQRTWLFWKIHLNIVRVLQVRFQNYLNNRRRHRNLSLIRHL